MSRQMINISVSIILGILIAGVKAQNNTGPIEKAKIAVGNAVENLIKKQTRKDFVKLQNDISRNQELIGCPGIFIEGKCYFQMGPITTFQNANCNQHTPGASLATINSFQTYTKLTHYIRTENVFHDNFVTQCWLGETYSPMDNQVQPLGSFTKWLPGYPRNVTNFIRIMLHVSLSSVINDGLINMPDSERAFHLCSYEEVATIDIDDCITNPCANDGTCNDQINSYTCTCAVGYTGVDCETIICTGFQYENRCFLMFADQKMTYENSAALCQQNSSTLAYVQSQQLYDGLLGYIRSKIPSGSSWVFVWLGGTYDPNGSSNDVNWNDGSQTDVSGKWYPDYPYTVAKYGLSYANFVKVSIEVASNATSVYQGFNNYPASATSYQLCEYSM